MNRPKPGEFWHGVLGSLANNSTVAVVVIGCRPFLAAVFGHVLRLLLDEDSANGAAMLRARLKHFFSLGLR